MDFLTPEDAIRVVPAGRWVVGVSGGADSVALLELLRHRGDLSLHVAHLDHETRAGESAKDAASVHEQCARWGVPCTIALRSTIELNVPVMPANRSARYRAARIELFRQVIAGSGSAGVIVAHHADDQAETILQRLLRGSSAVGITGMRAMTTIGGVKVLRPLLDVRGAALRAVLTARGIPWREDQSNSSTLQQRNRVRAMLREQPELVEPLLELGNACAGLTAWIRGASREPAETLRLDELRRLPLPLAREFARRWLIARAGVRSMEMPPAAIERLLAMAFDAATAPRQHFSGNLLVRRRGGRLTASPGAGS